MTDELTPEQEADVRRLLAEARHDRPIPADVVARLDAVLGDLSADDLEAPDSATVTELAGQRHRRRNAGRLLLAAAAVVIGGVAIGQTLGDTSFEGDDAATAESGALAEAPRDGTTVRDEAGGDDAVDSSEVPEAGPAEASLLDALEVPVVLTSADFAGDVQRALATTSALRSEAANADVDGLAFAAASSGFVCADGPYGEGARIAAYYDEEETVLVLRRPRSGMQRVDLLTCGTAVELNSVSLPAP